MKKNYLAITEHGCIDLGQHLDRSDALDYAVDRFNIHQANNYLIMTEYEAASVAFDIGQIKGAIT